MFYQQEINGRLWLNPGSCGYKRFTLPLSLAVMTIEDGRFEVETIWLEKSYGTPGAAKAQMEKAKVSKYEKQQRRYKQKAGKAGTETQAGDKEQRASQKKEAERDSLFMIAKIQRLKKAGETRDWVIRNLGDGYKLAGTVYDICEKKPGLSARQILELLKEQIMSV